MSELRFRPDQERRGFLLALPAILWLGLFFVLPLLLVLVLSFLYPERGGLGGGFGDGLERPLITFNAYADVLGLNPNVGTTYLRVVLNSIWIAFLTTVICLVVGYPLGFYIGTRKNEWVKNFTLFLVILPFWTNFLVRTYAWRVILGTEDGVINATLSSLGWISEPLQMMFTPGAVLVGLVYGFLPFMVLPIYASVERFDFRYVEASHDLGANDFWAFMRVVLPMTLPGVIAGCILVFIPAIGAFVTPELLGGTSVAMLGKTITDQFRGSGGNWPRGAAFSMVMMAVVMLSLLVYVRFGTRRD